MEEVEEARQVKVIDELRQEMKEHGIECGVARTVSDDELKHYLKRLENMYYEECVVEELSSIKDFTFSLLSEKLDSFLHGQGIVQNSAYKYSKSLQPFLSTIFQYPHSHCNDGTLSRFWKAMFCICRVFNICEGVAELFLQYFDDTVKNCSHSEAILFAILTIE